MTSSEEEGEEGVEVQTSRCRLALPCSRLPHLRVLPVRRAPSPPLPALAAAWPSATRNSPLFSPSLSWRNPPRLTF